MAKYSIIDHGMQHAQYFQGYSAFHTAYDLCVTGVADNAKEAYQDAVEQIAQIHSSKEVEHLRLPLHPRGIRTRPYVQVSAEDCYWYVSILYTL